MGGSGCCCSLEGTICPAVHCLPVCLKFSQCIHVLLCSLKSLDLHLCLKKKLGQNSRIMQRCLVANGAGGGMPLSMAGDHGSRSVLLGERLVGPPLALEAFPAVEKSSFALQGYCGG